MGKKAKARRETFAKPKPAVIRHAVRPSPNWPLLALSGAGVLLTAYLTWTSTTGQAIRGCAVGSGCDVVMTSRWGTLFGLPTAFWGLLTYAGLAAASFIRREDRHWTIGWTIALFGFIYSVYLTVVSLTVLDAACPYCLTSFGLMTAIFALTTFQRPGTIGDFQWPRWLVRTLPVPLIAILVLHLHYSGVIGRPPAAEDPMARALAEHLSSTGAKFYGASWCPHCQEQKAIFGRSAVRLPYVECSPGGRSAPQAEECRSLGINSYPTWVIAGKRIEDFQNLTQLAESSGFKRP